MSDIPPIGDNWALFLDVDGTLIEIATTPSSATAPREVIGLLERIAKRLDGALALVSGRPIVGIDRIFAPLRLPAAGLHGIERRNVRGEISRAAIQLNGVAEARAALLTIERRMPGILLEDKGDTIAVHYRRAPRYEQAILDETRDIAKRANGTLELLHGKMVIELRPPGPNKGSAIANFMDEAPFAGRVPVFVGDDVTDEAGFRAVNFLGGSSVRVGARNRGDATYYLRDVAHLHRFLGRIASADTHARS